MPLSNAEIFEHIGRLVEHGFDIDEDVNLKEYRSLMRWAKDYVDNGTFGTQAERQEAMATARDKAFAKMTGLDPVANAHQKAHWLPRAES